MATYLRRMHGGYVNVDHVVLAKACDSGHPDKPFYELYFIDEMRHGMPCGATCNVLASVWLDYLGVPSKHQAARWLSDCCE